jgi:hypothetical protein
MSKQRVRILTVASLGLLAVILGSPALWAGPPAQVILESDSWPSGPPPAPWVGPAIIWIDGIKYEGTAEFVSEGESNKTGWHGTELQRYDFGDLGTLELSGTAKTTYAYISPEHRWHQYTSHMNITGGTGAFAEAQGVFQFVGYTDWDPNFLRPPHAFIATDAKIVGIQMD